MTKVSFRSVDLDVVTDLYDQLSDVVFFAKDRIGRYQTVNQTLVERSGLAGKAALIGQTPSELFGTNLGKSYERQDMSVVSTGRSITQKLEMHVYANKTVGWCLTSKHPVLGKEGTVIGLIGISQDIRSPNMSRSEYDEVASVVEWVFENLESLQSIQQIVNLTGMSQFKLNRRFRAVFDLDLGQWIIKQRIDRAQKLLTETAAPIAEIAFAAGYSDQSALTRQFRLSTGLTPRQFRLLATPE
ncbi:MAG: AraC family transcriptional regulator [Erythrobacter sp.]|uniref:AraC family transcriptional regulator n=1 Tax=Erythrobacter sp. TaxID=1042 RepID=UPI0032998AD1